MKILYISTVTSSKNYDRLFKLTNGNLKHSIQNFHSKIINGLKENGNDITVLSGTQISNKNCNKKFFSASNHTENNIKYKNTFFVNFPILKQMCVMLFMTYNLLKWCFINRKNDDKTIILDAAYVTVNPIIVFLANFFNVRKSCIVCDIYDYMSLDISGNRNIIKFYFCLLTNYVFKHCDFFVLLTEAMNNVVNKRNKPYIIMEGIVEGKLKTKKVHKKKAIMYAGILSERYGVKLLIDSFLEWDNNDFELWLCGHGELIEYIDSLNNCKIKYYGILDHKSVTKLESEAMLLVNPRFSNEEYTKYSFPSKNMEYMMSSTPLLTTKLPGMPEEYNQYVYIIEDETKEGIIKKFNDILNQNISTLKEFGKSAQKFVLENKNQIVQARKITDGLEKIKIEKVHKPENILITIYLSFFIFFILLSNCNPFGLYDVSSKTYFLIISHLVFTVLGIKLLFNKKQTNEYSKAKDEDFFTKLISSKYFNLFLLITLVIVIFRLGKYLSIIRDLDKTQIRLAAYTLVYSNAFEAVFNIYIISNIITVIMILFSIILFDKKIKLHNKKISIILIILIIVLYSLIGFGRMIYLKLIYACLFAIFYFVDLKEIFNIKKIIKYIFPLIIIFAIACAMMYVRVFDNKFNLNDIFEVVNYQFKQIFEYFLGSFRALDSFIKNGFDNFYNVTWGRATLAGIDEIVLYPIKFLGSEILSFNQQISVITQKGIAVGAQTPYYNAFYTAIMNFYLDFGVIGVCVISFLYGMFIKLIINMYEKTKSLMSKIMIIFVSINLLQGILTWEYQAGKTAFLIILLIAIENLDLILIYLKKLLEKNKD